MRALVVYESMYGNTEHVAQAIAEGLGELVEVATVEVGRAPHVLPAELELLVVGGPTHGHGMSRASSREDAAKRVDRPVISKSVGMREWIESLTLGQPIDAATFDTRINGPEVFTGSAAKGAQKALRALGFRVGDHASFVLDGASGSPFDRVASAELERARGWGRSLVALLRAGAV